MFSCFRNADTLYKLHSIATEYDKMEMSELKIQICIPIFYIHRYAIVSPKE